MPRSGVAVGGALRRPTKQAGRWQNWPDIRRSARESAGVDACPFRMYIVMMMPKKRDTSGIVTHLLARYYGLPRRLPQLVEPSSSARIILHQPDGAQSAPRSYNAGALTRNVPGAIDDFEFSLARCQATGASEELVASRTHGSRRYAQAQTRSWFSMRRRWNSAR